MWNKRKPSGLLIGWITLFAALILGACGVSPQPQSGPEGTLTPTATLDPSGYQAIAPRSCMRSDWSTIQAERRLSGQTIWLQGNLLAFRPHAPGDEQPEILAYLAPSERSSWLTGVLTIASGPDFDDHIQLAPNVMALGDLTWSPSGDWLAFLAIRSEDGLHTVMVVRPDGTGLVDLFPADLARTDGRSSQKAIIGWKDDQTVEVIASCGEECRLAFDADIAEPNRPALVPTPVANYKELSNRLQIERYELEYDPDQFPKGLTRPHWAPDDNQLVYLDRRALLWYLAIDEKINYYLDIGLRDVYETRWSDGSDLLAVRAEDRVFLFEIPCRNSVED